MENVVAKVELALILEIEYSIFSNDIKFSPSLNFEVVKLVSLDEIYFTYNVYEDLSDWEFDI